MLKTPPLRNQLLRQALKQRAREVRASLQHTQAFDRDLGGQPASGVEVSLFALTPTGLRVCVFYGLEGCMFDLAGMGVRDVLGF